MAHDIQSRMDVALKITIPGEKGEYEYQMQNEFLRTVRDTSSLVTHQGSFSLLGHGGSYHRVLVLPLLCLNIGSYISHEAAARGIEIPLRCWTCASRYCTLCHPQSSSWIFSIFRLDANPVHKPQRRSFDVGNWLISR